MAGVIKRGYLQERGVLDEMHEMGSETVCNPYVRLANKEDMKLNTPCHQHAWTASV